MLPKTLLPLWSDYRRAVLDCTVILNAYLDRPAWASLIGLDSDGILTHGVESEWTTKHLQEAAARLCAWCAGAGRYFANVSVKQDIKREDTALLCPPLASDNMSFRLRTRLLSRLRKPPQWVVSEFRPFNSHRLEDGDLLLVDAPLSIAAEQNKRTASLCDFPPFLRRPDDAFVPLHLAAGPFDELAVTLGDGKEWMPFCRTLGILRVHASGQTIDVLQISVRTPQFLKPGWSARLVKEADDLQFHKAWSDDSVYLNSWIDLYRFFVSEAEKEHPGLDDSALALHCGGDLAARILAEMRNTSRLFEVENNPYERTEGFWTMLASMLPAWRDRFPLRDADVSALLRNFDAAYDGRWHTLLRDLSLSGLFRFTPDAMKRIRARIAALSSHNVETGGRQQEN